MATASDSRERDRRARAQAVTQSPTEQSPKPIFGAPVRVNQAPDHISHSVQQVLGSMDAMNPANFAALIGIPKQPQTPTVESRQAFQMNPPHDRRHNGTYPTGGHHRGRNVDGSALNSSHSKHGSSQKTTSKTCNSTERRKSSQKSRPSSGQEGSASSKGGSNSSSKTSKPGRPSLDFSQLNNSQSNSKTASKPDRTSRPEGNAHAKGSAPQPMAKLSPLNAGANPPQAPRSKAGLKVQLPSHSLQDSEDMTDGFNGDMETIMKVEEDDATRLATHHGEQLRPPSRSGQGSKDKKVQDILRIYTEHSAPRPISAICTPLKENAPKFPFEDFPKKLEPIIDEQDEEVDEDPAEENDDKGPDGDNSDSDDDEGEEEEDNSSFDKTPEDTTQVSDSAMVKEEGAGGETSSESEDEESQSSSEESGGSESEDSSNSRQTRDPSPKPKEKKSFSLQNQIQKVYENSKKFHRLSENSQSNGNLPIQPPSFDRPEVKQRPTSSPGADSQDRHHDDERLDDADDEEEETEMPRTPVKETKKPANIGRGKTVPKPSRSSSESKKAPVKPGKAKVGGSQGERVGNNPGKAAPTKGTKSFDATKKGKEAKKVKVEKPASADDGASKKRRQKVKKEEKFPSKCYISTSSDSEDDTSRTIEPDQSSQELREPKLKSPHPTSSEHRTNSSKGKSPLVRAPSKGPPQLSKIREKSSERRAPRKSISSSEDETHPVLSPVSVKKEDTTTEVEEAAATLVASPLPPVALDSSDLSSSFAKGDIPHLVVSFDLALIKQLPPTREDRKSLFGPSKRKDTLDTEKPSAIVKPYQTSRKTNSDSRKEKIMRTESRRPRTDSSSRSPRRIRDTPLPLTEQPPVIEPPILPSDPSRTLDRRRSSSQTTDLSIRRELEPPPPKRSRSNRLDSHDGGRGQVAGWNLSQPNNEESPEGMFGNDERLGDPLHRGTWEGEGFHQPGIFRNSDLRRHSFEERQQFSSDDYLAEGKRLKHLADSQTDKYTQSLTYFEAALAFIMCGNNFEHDPNYPDEKAIKMYSDTCKIIKWLIGIHSGSDARSNGKKLASLCYRIQALLNMRMYTMKRAATTKLAKDLNEHFKSSKSSQQNQSSWNPSSKYSETPSPMSPTPSPAGSVGSIGSMGSQGSNHSSDIPPATTSSKVGPGMNNGGTMIPQRIYNMMSTYMANSTYCLTSIDYWEQADTLTQENQDFFQIVHEHCGVLTLHSSILDLVQYSKYCLDKLKEL